jgi:hypothetical protein
LLENHNHLLRIQATSYTQLLKSANLQSLDILVSFQVGLFTNVPADEALQVLSNKLHNDDILAEWSALHKPLLWLHCVDETFVWPHNSEQLKNFLSHLNSLRPTIQCTMELESDSAIPFMDVVVIRKESTPTTEVYRKPTHTGQNLNV